MDGAEKMEALPSMEERRTIADFDPPKKQKHNKYAQGCTLLASITSILLGYDIGVMSGASLYIKDDLKFNDTQIEILTGIISVYCLIGSCLGGRTSDWIGRRYTIVVSGVIFFVGALVSGFATNFALLMVGRFIAGVGVGYGLMIAPVYTAEIAAAEIRGRLTSLPEVMIDTGVLLGYVSNYAFSKLPTHLGWRFMLGIAAIPSVLIGVGVLFLPESPRWLVMQGRLGDAKRVLHKITNSPEEAKMRLTDIKEAAGIPEDQDDETVHVEKKKSRGEGVWKELLFRPTPVVRHILVAGVGALFFQQASGVDTVVLYSPRIFDKAGMQTSDQKLLATIAVGFTKTIFVFVSVFLLDRVGRRPLLLLSVGCMSLSFAILATSLTVIDHSEGKVTWAIVLALCMVLACVASFSMGLGPIVWVYNSEIYPLKLRATGMGIGIAANRMISGIIAMTFISLYKAITIGGAFFLFAGIGFISWVFVFFCLPETQGRTIENTERLFGTMFKWRPIFVDKNKMDQ